MSDHSLRVLTMMNKIRTIRLRRMRYPCEDNSNWRAEQSNPRSNVEK